MPVSPNHTPIVTLRQTAVNYPRMAAKSASGVVIGAIRLSRLTNLLFGDADQ
jgi:hypothetical protein